MECFFRRRRLGLVVLPLRLDRDRPPLPAPPHVHPGDLHRALSHRSLGHDNNERLEFLGDALLNFAIGEALYLKLPKAAEGGLSRLRATLVREETLASVARRIELGEVMRLGSGELKS